MDVIKWSYDVGGGKEVERVKAIGWDLGALFS